MATEISQDTQLKLDLKTIGIIVAGAISLASMYFVMQADIARAMELPKPAIDRVEYDLKDELIRQTIMDTQEDVDMILDKLEKLDERLYDMQKNR